jgi:hypothetical protein
MRSIFLIFVSGCCLGCGDSEELASLKSSLRITGEEVVAKQDESIGILRENTTALARIETKLEASLAKSEPQNGKDGDPASAPNPPAKANTQQTPLKVATPGDFSQETLVELATRLYAQGVNTHMKTEEQLKAIDAQLNGGQPVTGGIFQNQRTSAVTSQRSTVRLVPRGKGVVRWQRNTSGQTCGPNGCY